MRRLFHARGPNSHQGSGPRRWRRRGEECGPHRLAGKAADVVVSGRAGQHCGWRQGSNSDKVKEEEDISEEEMLMGEGKGRGMPRAGDGGWSRWLLQHSGWHAGQDGDGDIGKHSDI
jgi:hypothetical protein